MKKIFLLMTIMTSLFFALSINSNAFTFNGSYDFSNVDLNASLTELNNASLNDLFNYEYLETLPLIEWNGYRNKYEVVNGAIVFNEYIYIDLGYKNLFNGQVYNGEIYSSSTGLPVNNPSWYRSNDYIDVIGNTTYTISGWSLDGYIYEYSSDFTFLQRTYIYPGGGTFTTLSNSKYLSFATDNTNGLSTNIQLEFGDTATTYVPYGVLTEVYRLYTTPIQNNDLIQSLYLYNLETINIDLLNYYFAVYLLNAFDLPIGDLWSYAWTAGNDAGYNDGFTDGQIAGYSDGYSDGNAFGYSDGFSDGQTDGYNTAVNDQLGAGDWLVEFIAGAVGVLGVTILPGVPLGLFVFIPLFFGLISFVYRLGGRKT